jgi:hypothetical protein
MGGAVVVLSALAVCCVASVGCVATVAVPPPRGVIVSGPPPAPIVEMRSQAPGAGAIWVTGYWHWTGMQYTWIPGHWEVAPPVGAVWVGPRYVLSGGVYVYQPGGWRRGPLPTPPQGLPPPQANALH